MWSETLRASVWRTLRLPWLNEDHFTSWMMSLMNQFLFSRFNKTQEYKIVYSTLAEWVLKTQENDTLILNESHNIPWHPVLWHHTWLRLFRALEHLPQQRGNGTVSWWFGSTREAHGSQKQLLLNVNILSLCFQNQNTEKRSCKNTEEHLWWMETNRTCVCPELYIKPPDQSADDWHLWVDWWRYRAVWKGRGYHTDM